MITAETIDQLGGVRHGFFTRLGGVSGGPYASLNCGFGSGDARERVAANRERAMGRLGLPATALVTAHQVHSARAVVVEAPWLAKDNPTADALVTRTPGIALGVLAADCAPVLLVDPAAGVVGAAHAGWRGARAGVLEATVATMVGLGAAAERIVAAIGPCIQKPSYEVGPEFRDEFLAEAPANRDFFAPAPRAGHYRFDLSGYLRRRLDKLALKEVEVLPYDTCGDGTRFFSYRRTVRRGETAYGRGLSAVALEG